MRYTDAQVAAVLEEARAKMHTSGKHWIQGRFRKRINGENCYCAMGAVYAVTKSRALRNQAFQALLSLGIKGRRYDSVWLWNDSPRRTWKQVDAAFRRAAEALKK
jgi:hypothetical protein